MIGLKFPCVRAIFGFRQDSKKFFWILHFSGKYRFSCRLSRDIIICEVSIFTIKPVFYKPDYSFLR